MKQRIILSHFQDYLFQYISHQYQNLLYCNSSQYILSTYTFVTDSIMIIIMLWFIENCCIFKGRPARYIMLCIRLEL